MKKILLVISTMLFILPAFAQNVDKEVVEQLNEYLPQGWKVSSIDKVSAPQGWVRTQGDEGLRICIKKAGEIREVFAKSNLMDKTNPHYYFTIMPLNWQGTSLFNEQFKSGQINDAKASAKAIYRDKYISGMDDQYYYFQGQIEESQDQDDSSGEIFYQIRKYFNNRKNLAN